MGSNSREEIVHIKPLSSADGSIVFEWRNSEKMVRLSSSQTKVDWEQHKNWIHESIDHPLRKVFIIYFGQDRVGQIRFDIEETKKKVAQVSIYVIDGFEGKGIGSASLRKASKLFLEQFPAVDELRALVRLENEVSQQFFRKLNYKESGQDSLHGHINFKCDRRDFNQYFNISLYSNLVAKYDVDVKSLNWGSKESQDLRFKILAEIGDLPKRKVVDVGCGLGDFYQWLLNNHIDCEYLGTDLTATMIAKAKKRFPSTNFVCADAAFEGEADYVFVSGMFAYQDQAFLEKTVATLFAKCREGLAFNSLSSFAAEKDEGEFYASPFETMKFCRSITNWVTLRTDYHTNDFTIYMYKNRQT